MTNKKIENGRKYKSHNNGIYNNFKYFSSQLTQF